MVNWKFWNQEKKFRMLEEEYNFLKYIYKNGIDKNKVEENTLKNKFGKEEYDRIYNQIGGRFISYLPRKEADKKENICYILDEGKKFIEEYERKNIELKYSKLMFYSSIGLIIVTIFYVIFTANLVQISQNQFEVNKNQFESLNRPYFFIENISTESNNLNEAEIELTISNVGNMPGRIVSLGLASNNCAESKIFKTFGQTTLLGSNKQMKIKLKGAVYIEGKNTIDILLKYTGIGELKDKDYEFLERVNFYKDKEKITQEIIEGDI